MFILYSPLSLIHQCKPYDCMCLLLTMISWLTSSEDSLISRSMHCALKWLRNNLIKHNRQKPSNRKRRRKIGTVSAQNTAARSIPCIDPRGYNALEITSLVSKMSFFYLQYTYCRQSITYIPSLRERKTH